MWRNNGFRRINDPVEGGMRKSFTRFLAMAVAVTVMACGAFSPAFAAGKAAGTVSLVVKLADGTSVALGKFLSF